MKKKIGSSAKKFEFPSLQISRKIILQKKLCENQNEMC